MRFVTEWRSLAIQASGNLGMALGVLVAISTRRNAPPSTWMAPWNRQHEVFVVRTSETSLAQGAKTIADVDAALNPAGLKPGKYQ
jgi:hypothetical protein